MGKRKLNILLVDDDNINNYVSENIIKKTETAGHIEKRLNGKEAIEFIQASLSKNKTDELTDLILVDINMPLMDGMEFLEEFNKIKEKYNTVIYLMHAAELTPEQKERTGKVYLSGNIEKPLTTEKFSKILSTHFQY
jgi:CheY-like chemotaxis protein